jgi:cobalt/nickel transport system ATP-binding protein
MDNFAIDADHVSFAYPNGFMALEDVVFRVSSGEFVAMLASNGSGKTTLIKILVGLLKPQTGTVKIGGRTLSDYSDAQLYQRVGLVFQNPNDQLVSATVAEDVAFGPRNLGLTAEEVRCRIDEALHCVGADHLGHPSPELRRAEARGHCRNAGHEAFHPDTRRTDRRSRSRRRA